MNKTATYKRGGGEGKYNWASKKKAQKLKINWNSLSKSSATQDVFSLY